MPSTVRAAVTSSDVWASWSVSLSGPGSTSFASPKSSTFTSPSRVTMMFAGFRSRWITPFACANAMASAIGPA